MKTNLYYLVNGEVTSIDLEDEQINVNVYSIKGDESDIVEYAQQFKNFKYLIFGCYKKYSNVYIKANTYNKINDINFLKFLGKINGKYKITFGKYFIEILFEKKLFKEIFDFLNNEENYIK